MSSIQWKPVLGSSTTIGTDPVRIDQCYFELSPSGPTGEQLLTLSVTGRHPPLLGWRLPHGAAALAETVADIIDRYGLEGVVTLKQRPVSPDM